MSTAAAAQALLNEEDSSHSAAICSPICASVNKELEILQENIQDTNSKCPSFSREALRSLSQLVDSELHALLRARYAA